MSFLILYNYFDFHVSQLNQVFQSQDGLLSDRKKRWVLTSRKRDVVLRGMQRYGPFSVIFRALFTKWLIFRHTLSHSPVIQNYCYIFLLYVYTHTHTHTHIVIFVQSPRHVRLFVTPWIAACQTTLSFTISWSLPKFKVKKKKWTVFLCILFPSLYSLQPNINS